MTKKDLTWKEEIQESIEYYKQGKLKLVLNADVLNESLRRRRQKAETQKEKLEQPKDKAGGETTQTLNKPE